MTFAARVVCVCVIMVNEMILLQVLKKIIKNVIQKINTITSAKLAVTVGLLSLFLIYCSLGTALHVYASVLV